MTNAELRMPPWERERVMEKSAGSLSASKERCGIRPVLFEQITEIIDPEPHSAALNMAVDEALLQRVTEPTLRIYRWSRPAVSLGYFSLFHEAERIACGRELVRRWTGGGLVEHGNDITYTLLVPRDAAFFQFSPLDSYRLIHEQIARWLKSEDLETDVFVDETTNERASACFVQPVQYDIVAHGLKIAGAAQRRTRWGLLHQGSIQLPTGLCGRASMLPRAFSGKVTSSQITAETQSHAEQIARDRYATDAWLKRF